MYKTPIGVGTHLLSRISSMEGVQNVAEDDGKQRHDYSGPGGAESPYNHEKTVQL